MAIELTSKQKSLLRGLGQSLDAQASVGKAGLTAAVAQSISALLAAKELVKVHIPAGSGDDRKAMGQELAAATGAVCVGVLGRTVLLYKPNPDLPPAKRIAIGG
jgi:RNA-binding protein